MQITERLPGPALCGRSTWGKMCACREERTQGTHAEINRLRSGESMSLPYLDGDAPVHAGHVEAVRLPVGQVALVHVDGERRPQASEVVAHLE